GEKPKTRTITLIILVKVMWGGLDGWVSVAGKFGHGFLGAVVVDECLAGGGGRDQCGDGGVIQRARQSQAGLMESRDRIIGDERIGTTYQRKVVLQVLG